MSYTMYVGHYIPYNNSHAYKLPVFNFGFELFDKTSKIFHKEIIHL